MLIKYVRNKNWERIGVVVAIDAGRVGWAKLKKGDKWDKEFGLRIARGRAMVGSSLPVPSCMVNAVNDMIDRSHRYFKHTLEVE